MLLVTQTIVHETVGLIWAEKKKIDTPFKQFVPSLRKEDHFKEYLTFLPILTSIHFCEYHVLTLVGTGHAMKIGH